MAALFGCHTVPLTADWEPSEKDPTNCKFKKAV